MKKNFLQQGFTLIEVLVSLALFTIIVVAAVGSLYTINQASVNVNNMRSTLDNLNFATESMSRTIRTGSDIVCGGTDNLNPASPNCPFGSSSTAAGHKISFTSTLAGSEGELQYQWVNDQNGNGEIQKCDVQNDTLLNCVSITSPEIDIQHLYFYVDGADPADMKQPSVIMLLQGVANASNNQTAPFAIQTYVSQRAGE
jgi:prepilin-type N-terminal cleavage/methylation domain-containing protein